MALPEHALFAITVAGHSIADQVLGEQQELLEPFRFGRLARGELHPVSNSPYPWS